MDYTNEVNPNENKSYQVLRNSSPIALVKPALIESQIVSGSPLAFAKLGEGFKHLFTDSTKISKQ